MLKRLQLKNFRRHASLDLPFAAGLHVMRGGNEAGKSTCIESVAYALFGVKALRTSLDDAVTWGAPVASLKVELDIEIGGVAYNIRRSKGGAEVVHADGRVTGQTEVTNFMCGLLRADATAAGRLMLAQQTDIRGALDAGPKATSELIERLAEFSLLDDLVEAIHAHLPLGSTGSIQERISLLEEEVAGLDETPEPDFNALDNRIHLTFRDWSEACEAESRAEGEYEAAYKALTEAKVKADRIANLDRTLREAQQRYSEAARKAAVHADSSPLAPAKDVQDRIDGLVLAQAQVQRETEVFGAYLKVMEFLQKQPRDVYKGHRNDLVEAIRLLEQQRAASVTKSHDLQLQIAKLEAQIQQGSCTYCGLDLSEVQEVKYRNAKLNQSIIELQMKVGDLKIAQAELLTKINTFNSILKQGTDWLRNLTPYSQYLEEVDESFPPTVRWIGEPPPSPGTRDYRDELLRLRKSVTDYQDWLTEMQTMGQKLQTLKEDLERAQDARDGEGSAPGVTQFQDALAQAQVKRRDARDAASRALTAKQQAVRDLERAKEAWEAVRTQRDQKRAALDIERGRLKETEFNNALLKRVRSARPLIADRLWSQTLGAVSTYFSEMRGARSVVSKGSDGFLVDGRPVASLSGSTLDILGLAIRVALVRTFLPEAAFIILDEPASGCDSERTQSMLGFLSSIGFSQIILVTHEDISETVADHVITLESA